MLLELDSGDYDFPFLDKIEDRSFKERIKIELVSQLKFAYENGEKSGKKQVIEDFIAKVINFLKRV